MNCGEPVAGGFARPGLRYIGRMVEQTLQRFSRLDCSVNNAALDGPQIPTADYPEEVFDEVIATNVKGVWNCMST